jgi:ABC-type amino acid transport substrate-binding protein
VRYSLFVIRYSLFVIWCSVFVVCFVGCKSKPDLVWRRIQEQGVMRVGMEANWVPFEFVDGTGQLSGFDVELARALGDQLGLEVQFYPTLSFDGLYDALTAGQVDVVVSAVVVDVGRSADFAYSTPYFDAGQVLVVGLDGADVDEMGDLGDRVLAVELGSEGDIVARRWSRRLDGMSLLHTDSADAALDAVAGGRADAALTDRATALLALKAYGRRRAGDPFGGRTDGEVGLYISGAPVTGERYAVVVLKESSELLRALNAALDDMRREGTLAELERKWLGP